MPFKREPILSEFTAPHIRLEDYVRRPEWIALPLPIKVALVNLWRSEQPPVAGLHSDPDGSDLTEENLAPIGHTPTERFETRRSGRPIT
jgi:hypothetical protein